MNFFFFYARNTGALKAICVRNVPQEDNDGKVQELPKQKNPSPLGTTAMKGTHISINKLLQI